MKFGAVLFRFILLVTVFSLLVACKQESERDSPEVATPTTMPTETAVLPTEEPPPTEVLAIPPTEPPPTAESEERLVIENVPSPSLSGTIFGKDESLVYVYLPPSYHDSEKRYPTLYILPYGSPDIESTGSMISLILDRLVKDDGSDQMIIVMPDSHNSIGTYAYFADSPLNGDWQTFVAHDLVEYIDANYRTLPDPASRGLIGELESGAAALNLASFHCDLN